MVNECGKFCVKIFWHYIDSTIFAFGYFILPHPVEMYLYYDTVIGCITLWVHDVSPWWFLCHHDDFSSHCSNQLQCRPHSNCAHLSQLQPLFSYNDVHIIIHVYNYSKRHCISQSVNTWSLLQQTATTVAVIGQWP